MKLKTGILMLLVGIAVIGIATSSASAGWAGCDIDDTDGSPWCYTTKTTLIEGNLIDCYECKYISGDYNAEALGKEGDGSTFSVETNCVDSGTWAKAKYYYNSHYKYVDCI